MDPKSAAEAARIISPDIVVPIHYELLQEREDEFIQSVNNDTKAVILETYK